MLRRFKGGAVVACDVPGCPHTFRSFSRAALVRGQASSDGWTYRQQTKLEFHAAGPVVLDRCPTCSVVAVPATVAPASSVSIATAAEPEKLVSRDSSSLTTETISLVSGQPEGSSVDGVTSGVETVGGDRLSSTFVPGAEPAAVSPVAVSPRRKHRATRKPAPVVPKERKRRVVLALPGTLALVAEILRAATSPLSVREILELAGDRLPSKSKTPATVVSRDLALAIKHGGEASIFVRTERGRFTLRELVGSAGESRLASNNGVAA